MNRFLFCLTPKPEEFGSTKNTSPLPANDMKSCKLDTHFSFKASSGLTLIEVLIVVALIAILAVTAAPFTGSWIAESQITDAESTLTEAVGRAKSIAMKNKAAASGIGGAAIVCVSNNKVQVKERISNASGMTCLDSDTNVAETWSAPMPSEIDLFFDSSYTVPVRCMCFDRRGLATTSDCAFDNSNSCSSDSYIYFKRGTLARLETYVQ